MTFQRSMAMSIVAFVACTSAEFIDPSASLRNRTAVQSAAIIYSSQEDLTFAEWSFRADAPIEDFEILELKDDAWNSVDTAISLYDPRPARCAQSGSRCLRHVVRGNAHQSFRVVHPTLGELRRSTPLLQVASRTLESSAAFALGNASLRTTVTPSARLLAAREYEWTIFPIARAEECHPSGFVPSLTWKPVTDTNVTFARTDRGLFCHGVRPRDQRDGRAAIVANAVQMAPEVRDVSRTFSPEVRDDPLIVKLIHDESASPGTCARMRAAIDAALAVIPHTDLNPPIFLSGPTCAMTNARSFDANTVAYDMVTALANLGSANDEKTGLLLYVSNVSYGAPRDELLSVRNGIDANRAMRGAVWSVVPSNETTLEIPSASWADETVSWIGDVTETATTLRERLQEKLPTVTQRWSETAPVKLLGEEVAEFDGKFVKLCESVPAIDAPSTLHWYPVRLSSPPTFTVAGIVRVREPRSSFVPTTVRYTLQVCERYCDHPATPAYANRWNEDGRCFR